MSESVRPAPKHEAVPTPLRRAKAKVPAPVKAAIRGTARLYGRATSSRRTLPDFLIIGTKRGGTTSLWNALVGHEDVLPMFPRLQEIKSPHYFDISYGKGLAWYRSFFPTRADRRRHERRTGRRPVSGEASPYYMFHPLAPARIARDLPEVRLVVSLRNPVDRIWSHYNERAGSGTEELSFEEAIAAEEARVKGEEDRIAAEAPAYYSFHHDLSTYLARGRYAEHLRRYVDLFPPDQLLILRAEDFYADPLGELAKVADHLSIAADGFGPVEHYNRIPRDTMPADLREQLTEYYRPHVAELEAMLGRSFDWAGF